MVGKPTEVKIGIALKSAKLWVRRDLEWAPTVINEPGSIHFLQFTNLCDRKVILRSATSVDSGGHKTPIAGVRVYGIATL